MELSEIRERKEVLEGIIRSQIESFEKDTEKVIIGIRIHHAIPDERIVGLVLEVNV